MNDAEKIKKSLLWMGNNEHGFLDFMKNAVIDIEEKGPPLFATTRHVIITVDPQTLRDFKHWLDYFGSVVKEHLHKYFFYSNVIVNTTADWDKIQWTGTTIEAVRTPWSEINKMQSELLSLLHTSASEIGYRNIANAGRALLERLANIVFDAKSHGHHSSADRDLGKGKYKNQLWAFVETELSLKTAYKKLSDYASSLLTSTSKAIDLLNDSTHSSSADEFVAKTCVISVIATIQLAKIVDDIRNQ